MSSRFPRATAVASRHAARRKVKKTACVVAVSKKEGVVSLLKIRDRNYVPRIKIVREMQAGTEIAHLFDTWTGWSEGVNEYGIGVVSSALMVVNDENEKKEPTGRSRNGDRIRQLLGAKNMDAAIEIALSSAVSGCTFISDGKKTVLVEYDPKIEGDPILRIIKDGATVVRTNHGVFLEGAGYTSGADLKSSEERKETAEKVLAKTKKIMEIAPAMGKARKKDRGHPNNVLRKTDNMTTSTLIVTIPKDRKMLVYLIPDEVAFLGVENKLPKGRKPKVKVEVFDYEKWDSPNPIPIALDGDWEIFRLFTYDSMMGKPSYEKDVLGSYKAVLKDYHRAYNRSSQNRNDAPVIGTEPGGQIEGVIHEYPIGVAHRVLGRVDQREGFRTERDEKVNSYLRSFVPVEVKGKEVRTVVYLSNPKGPNYFKPLSAEAAAKVIENEADGRKYLRRLEESLKEYKCKDAYISDIANRVQKARAKKVAALYVEAGISDWLQWIVQPIDVIWKHHKEFVQGPIDDAVDAIIKDLAPLLVKQIGEHEIDADVDEFTEGAVVGRFEGEQGSLYDERSPLLHGQTEDFAEGYEWGWYDSQLPRPLFKGKKLPSNTRREVTEEALRDFRHRITEEVVAKMLKNAWKAISPRHTFHAIVQAVKKHGWKIGVGFALFEIIEHTIVPAIVIQLTGDPKWAVLGTLPIGEILMPVVLRALGSTPNQADQFDEDGHLDWYEDHYGPVRIACLHPLAS